MHLELGLNPKLWVRGLVGGGMEEKSSPRDPALRGLKSNSHYFVSINECVEYFVPGPLGDKS